MKDFLKEATDKIGLVLSEYEEKITLFGFKGIQFEGHKGILSYADDIISVKVGKKLVTVHGKNLSVKEVTKDELLISGKICGLEVENAI